MQTSDAVVYAETLRPLVVSLAVSVLTSGAVSYAASEQAAAPPSRQQLRRLAVVEPYVRYFASLEYGPERVRTSPDLIRALVLVESGARTWAHSSRGARGLAQIMPRTARHVAAELAASGRDFLYVDEARLADLSDDDLHDPATNLLLACYLTARLRARYDGHLDLTLAAWNAGPSVVSRHGNRPPPFPETQRMIARVRDLMDLDAY